MPSVRPVRPFAVALFSCTLAEGAGFLHPPGSATGLGRAYSGEGVMADDASVLSSNPAALLLLPQGTSVASGIIASYPQIDFDGHAGTPPSEVVGGNRVVEEGYLPYLYATHRIGDWSVGLGVFHPFGFETDYPVGAQLTDLSRFRTVSFSPAVAYRLSDALSVGAGLDVLYGELELTSTTSVPTVNRILDFEADDWGVGFNLGILWEATQRLRFGLHYRSQVRLELEGSGRDVPGGIAGDGSLDLELPDTLELSARFELSERVAVHAGANWTHWEEFATLSPTIDGTGTFSQHPSWKDALRLAVGASWEATDKLTVRVGVAFDDTPVPRRTSSILRIPDAAGYWLSAGLSYQFTDDLRLDAGYTRILQDDAQFDEIKRGNGNFYGESEGHLNLVALGLSGTL